MNLMNDGFSIATQLLELPGGYHASFHVTQLLLGINCQGDYMNITIITILNTSNNTQ